MAEPLPAGSTRQLQVSEGLTSTGDPSSLEITVGDCLRFLPGRREVYQVARTPGDTLVAKRFLPHPKMKRDARREWRGLRFMHEHGLPGPEPYCLASDAADGGLWVLMSKIEGLQPLDELIDQASIAGDEGKEIARQMACAVQKMHACGARQTDQHAANWGWAGGAVHILDAGTIQISGSALAESDRLNDLAGICVTLSPAMEQDFREELRASCLSDWTDFAAKLDRAVGQTQRARLRRYDAKTRRTCTEFERDVRQGVLCLLDRRVDRQLLEAFRKAPEGLMAVGTLLKAGNTCTVAAVEYGGRHYVLKRYNKKPLFQRLRARFKRSRAMRSWSGSWLLKMAFVPTPRAVAVYEEYASGLRERCYLLMEAIPGQLLDEYVAGHRDDPAKLAAVASDFARIWSALGRMRAAHGDFKATNFIVGASGQLYLFDLDAFAFNLPVSVYRRRRDKDWKRFMKNWSGMPEVGRVFEEAVLREKPEVAE